MIGSFHSHLCKSLGNGFLQPPLLHPDTTPTPAPKQIELMYIFNGFVATKDSNPIYSAYGITFSAQTNPQYQNHSFYSEPMLLPTSDVYKDLDTSWEEKPCSLDFWRPAV